MATPASELPRKHKLSVTDYYRLANAGSLLETDRVELMDGEIIDMAPIGSRHAAKVGYLDRLLHRAVGDRAFVWTQMPLRLGTHSEPQPDMMLVKPQADFYARAHPGPDDVLLIIEVADSSLAYDRDTKIPLYARYGIPEVWLIDIKSEQLAIYKQPMGLPEGKPKSHRKNDTYGEIIQPAPLDETALSALPGLAIDLSGLF